MRRQGRNSWIRVRAGMRVGSGFFVGSVAFEWIDFRGVRNKD